jgi:hypothetical protein
VDQTSLEHVSHEYAVNTLKATGTQVTLLYQKGEPGQGSHTPSTPVRSMLRKCPGVIACGNGAWL